MRKAIAVALTVVALAAALAMLIAASSAGGSVSTAQDQYGPIPTEVGAFACISGAGGQVTRPPGSTIIIRQGFSESNFGALRNLLGSQTTAVSVNDAPMFDVSGQWGAPVQQLDGSWLSLIKVPTGVTLASPGDQMRFTFALVILGKVPEADGIPGKPAFNGPGLAFGGTCIVTAT